MAHLPIIRYATSFVQCRNSVTGTHEEVEENINKLKYESKGVREGTNTPFQTEFRFIDYRVKEEHISQLASDLDCINFNPKTNTITLFNMLSGTGNIDATVGVGFRLIQYMFKWINRKYLSSLILICFAYFNITSIFFSFIVIILLFINPLKPVDLVKKKNQLYTGWCYNFCFGYLKDMNDGYKHVNDEVMEDAL
jgi:hypothetical protein